MSGRTTRSVERSRSRSKGRPKNSPSRVKTPPQTSPSRPLRSRTSEKNKTPEKKRLASPSRRNKSPARKASPKSRTKSKSPEKKIIRMPKAPSVASEVSVKSSSLSDDSSDDSRKEAIIRNSLSKLKEKLAESAVVRRSTRFQSKGGDGLVNNSGNIKESKTKPEGTTHDGSRSQIWRKIFVFLSLLGSFIIIPLVPLVAVIVTLTCNKDYCIGQGGLLRYNWSSWRQFVDLEISFWYGAFVLVQMLLSLLPITKPSTGLPYTHKSIPSFRCTGILNATLSVGAVLTLVYLKFSLRKIVGKLPQLLLPSLALSLLLSLLVLIVGRKRPSSSNILDDFVWGKSKVPRFAALDLKTFLMKIYHVFVITYLLALIVAEVQAKPSYNNWNYSLLVACFTQMFLCFDYLVFEANSLTSYFIQVEPVGYFMTAAFIMSPFVTTIVPTYLFYNKVMDNYYLLALSWSLFCVGYLLYRISNNQKANFRRKPHLHSGRDEIVISKEGRNLLISGLWGWVRHPNYLGCLVAYWSVVPLCWGFWAAYLTPVLFTLEHIARVHMVEAHTAATHFSAWTLYTSRVPNALIPHVY